MKRTKRNATLDIPPLDWQDDFEARADAAFGAVGVPRGARYLASPESVRKSLGKLGQPDLTEDGDLLWWANVPNPDPKAGAAVLVGVLARRYATEPGVSLEPWTFVCIVPPWARPWAAAHVPTRLAS